jgi:hypothetical protein
MLSRPLHVSLSTCAWTRRDAMRCDTVSVGRRDHHTAENTPRAGFVSIYMGSVNMGEGITWCYLYIYIYIYIYICVCRRSILLVFELG